MVFADTEARTTGKASQSLKHTVKLFKNWNITEMISFRNCQLVHSKLFYIELPLEELRLEDHRKNINHETFPLFYIQIQGVETTIRSSLKKGLTQ